MTGRLKINAPHVIVFGISSTTGGWYYNFLTGLEFFFYIFLFFLIDKEFIIIECLSLFDGTLWVFVIYWLEYIMVFIDLLINAEVTHGGSKMHISVCINTAVF